ncbi:MAG: hypothetical protein R3E39_14845 [Anaerolineae bacterium]
MPVSRFHLVKQIVRGVKYRELSAYIGQTVLINSVESIEADLRDAIIPRLSVNCSLLSKERRFVEVALAKYGLVDLEFQVNESYFESDFTTGIQVLKSNRFFTTDNFDDPEIADFSRVVLEMCVEELGNSMNWVKLFLKTIDQQESRLKFDRNILPQTFVIVDACATNMPSIWLNKHFYL